MSDLSETLQQAAATIGDNLKARRKAIFPKDTQEQMAARLGIGVATYGRMERGDATVSLKHYLAAAEILKCMGQFHELYITGDDPQPGSLIQELILRGRGHDN